MPNNSSTKKVGPTHRVRLTADSAGQSNPKSGQWYLDGAKLGSPVGPPSYELEATVPADGARHTFLIAPVGAALLASPTGGPVVGKSGAASADSLAPICGANDGKGLVIAEATAGRCTSPDASTGDHDKRKVTLSFESNLSEGVWVQWFRDGVAIDQPVKSGTTIEDEVPISSSPVEYGLINYGAIKPQKLNGNTSLKSPSSYDDTVSLSLGPCEVASSIKSYAISDPSDWNTVSVDLVGELVGDHTEGTVKWLADGAPLGAELQVVGKPVNQSWEGPADGQSVDFTLTVVGNKSAKNAQKSIVLPSCPDLWPYQADDSSDPPATTGCPSHPISSDAKTVNETKATYSSYTETAPKLAEPLNGPVANMTFADCRSLTESDWKSLLRTQLHPVPGGDYSENVYFTNGVMTDHKKAEGFANMSANFFGLPNVRLIYNRKEGGVGELREMAYDYAWTQSGPAYSAPLGSSPDGAYEATAYIALLFIGYKANSKIGIVATSHGTAITAKAILAFAKAFPKAIPWMKSSLRVIHSGCVVHRNRYPVLRALTEKYEPHADPRDPFAFLLGGHDVQHMKAWYQSKKANQLQKSKVVKAFDRLLVRKPFPAINSGGGAQFNETDSWFTAFALDLLAQPHPLGLLNVGGVVGQSHYHAIEKSYMNVARHFQTDFFSS